MQRYLPQWCASLINRLAGLTCCSCNTNTVSHKMIRCCPVTRWGTARRSSAAITSSGTALTEILEEKCAVSAL